MLELHGYDNSRGDVYMQAIISIMPIFMIMLLGWFLKVKDIMNNDFIYKLNFIIYWVAIPALLFRMMLRCDINSISQMSLFKSLYLAFIFTPLLAWGLGIIRTKLVGFHEDRVPVSVLSSIRANNIFMGLPVVSLLIGDPGVEAVSIYLAVGMVGYHVMSIGIAQLAQTGRLSIEGLFRTLVNLMKNPIIISVVAGLCVSMAGLCNIPPFLDQFLGILAKTASGMALLAIGASFNHSRLFKAFKETWFDALFKLFVSPLVMWCAFLVWRVDGIMMNTVILICAMPVAVNTFSVAQGMEMDSSYASEVITTSTLLSVLSIPVWTFILGIS